jgi:hypothetical protein
MKICEVCGITSEETQVYSGRRFGMGLLCNRHQKQMSSHGFIKDSSRAYKRNQIIYKEDYAELIIDKKGDRFVVAIDKEDVQKALLYKWYVSSHGYVVHKSDKEVTYLHHLVMGVEGEKGKVYIDHEDKNKLNNRKSNLRITTNQENSMNKGVARSK